MSSLIPTKKITTKPAIKLSNSIGDNDPSAKRSNDKINPIKMPIPPKEGIGVE